MKNWLAILFLLLASPSWATVYYVNHSGEDGTNGHNGSTEALAWRTLAYAEDNLVAGDTVYVKADSAYTDADGANGCVLYVEKIGTAALPITFEGYKTTPGDGDDFADGSGRFEIDATGKTYGIASPVVSITNRYRAFRNCYVHGATSHGIDLSKTATIWCTNVESSLNGANGISGYSVFRNSLCIFSNNGSYGAYLGSNSSVLKSILKNNVSYALYISDNSLVLDCVFSQSAGTSFLLHILNYTSVINCAFYGSGSTTHGIRYLNTSSLHSNLVQNCIFVNVVKGIELYTGANNNTNYMSNNCFFGVPTPYTNCVSSGGDVLADPLFVDAANGDFHLRAGSPCIGAGVNGQDIGAYGFNGAGVLGLQATE